MADKFSAQWWNDQALQSGRLRKSDIELLTGMTFATVWNTDGTIVKTWDRDVVDRAPGFRDAHLLLDPGSGQGSRDVYEAAASKDPNWGDWAYFVSAVGYVAPGATGAWEPVLSPTYIESSTLPPPSISGPISPAPTTTGIDGPLSIQPPLVTGIAPPAPSLTPADTAPATFTAVMANKTSPISTPTSLIDTSFFSDPRVKVVLGILAVIAIVYFVRRK